MREAASRITVRSNSTEWQLPLITGASIRELLDATHLRVRASCGGTGGCGACTIRLVSGNATPLTHAEREKLSPEQQQQGYRLACQLRPVGSCLLELDDPAPLSAWRTIPADELHPVHRSSLASWASPLGVAVDLGTTHLRVSLWNRHRRLACRLGINPQVIHGADILNRLHEASRDPQRAEALSDLARQAISEALLDMLTRDLGEPAMFKKIGRVMIVGNTAMLTLLAGNGSVRLLDPEGWDPGLVCQPRDPERWQGRWGLPNGRIILVPPVDGFIGSDLLACVVATRLIEAPPGAMLLDLGTNIELALWDGRWLHVASTPGGPAFEMSGIRHGLPIDTPGAVTHLYESGEDLEFITSGHGPPQGYCGTGLLDAIAVLCRRQLLKPSGRFAIPVTDGGFPLDPDNPATAITGRDVDQFQRAKAACAAAVETLLDHAGLHPGRLHGLWLCGAFGAGLDVENARQLGLLPSLDPDRIRKMPGAALAGCESLLGVSEHTDPLAGLRARMRPVHLATHERFEDLFIRHLRLTIP
ncbi:MAG: ASKHA domain-containing protein [Magnetococcus sp. YQC-9]